MPSLISDTHIVGRNRQDPDPQNCVSPKRLGLVSEIDLVMESIDLCVIPHNARRTLAIGCVV
jgi:hypothetical protein